jgi:glycosyltransferase involved in cell wall biosynthesis
MKILLVLPRPLFPADTGGKTRSLNIFSRLAKEVEIHAVSFADRIHDDAAISQMKATFESYTPVFWREAQKYCPAFYAQVFANQFSSWPYFLAKCNRPVFRSTVEELVARQRFDLLLCDFLHTAAPLLEFSFKPRVVFEHNVEFLLRRRKWEVEGHPLRRWVFNAEWRKTRRIEGRVCRSFDHVITVSECDQQTLKDEFAIEHISTVPMGVDTDFFRPVDGPPQRGRLVFVGSMDWDPNEDGIVWFLREVYPRIRHAMPNASLSIVGRNPSSRLRAIATRAPDVEIAGRVSDVRPHLARSEVAVVPLRVSGGTRLKIPEAMAMAKPVISTSIGAEGLPFRDGREILLAERPEDFARAVVELLNNASLRDLIGRAAREEVVRKHSWQVVVASFQKILAQAAWPRNQTVCAWRPVPKRNGEVGTLPVRSDGEPFEHHCYRKGMGPRTEIDE